RRSADIEASPVSRIEGKAVKRGRKLDAASRHIRMCGSGMQRRVGRDFLGSLPHDLFVGGNQACFDRGLRLGTAFKDAAFDQQAVDASTCAAHDLTSGTMFHSWPLPALVAHLQRPAGRLFEEKQYGT